MCTPTTSLVAGESDPSHQVLLSLARSLITTTRADEVLEALRVALADAGHPPTEVCLLDKARDSRTDAESVHILFPVNQGGQPTSLDIAYPGELAGSALCLRQEIAPLAGLACAALRRITREDATWQQFLRFISSVGAALSEDEVAQELVSAVTRLFGVPYAHVLRHVPEQGGLRLQAVAGAFASQPHPLQAQVIPMDLLPAHHHVLEVGETATFHRAAANERMSGDEWQLLYPAPMQSCMCLPFWLGTEALGVLSMGSAESTPPEVPHFMLRVLLYHASIAFERAALFRAVSLARREADLLLAKTFTGILLLNPLLTVVRANDAAAAIWQMSPEDLIGRHVTTVFGREIMHRDSPLVNAMETHQAQEPAERVVATASGESRDVLLAVTPLLHEDHDVLGYLLSLVDITRLKNVERLKDRMLANVSHEMRTPIAVIRGYAELLRSMEHSAGEEDWLSGLGIIEEQADRLATMVQMYLDLAQLEAREFVLRKERFDVASVLRDVYAPYGLLGQKRQVEVKMEVGEDVGEAILDMHLFRQIVRNLVDNAMKFSPCGGHVWLRALAVNHDLWLEVEDEGPGVPPGEISRIFDRFYRGKQSGYDTPGTGTGLGLTLVKQAVEAHGGTITLETEMGRGSLFRVVFPGALC